MSGCCARCDFNDREEMVMSGAGECRDQYDTILDDQTCTTHEGMRLPCPLPHKFGHVLVTPETCTCNKRSDSRCPICDGGLAVCAKCGEYEAGLDKPCKSNPDEAILDEVDERRSRTFESVINDWTAACIAENQAAPDPATVIVITRLGLLGQRLIYEANDIGMRQVMAETKERLGL